MTLGVHRNFFLRATPTLGVSGGVSVKNRVDSGRRRQNFDFNHYIENVRHRKLMFAKKKSGSNPTPGASRGVFEKIDE